ncbi:MAG: START domain-containing protein [bacterium]
MNLKNPVVLTVLIQGMLLFWSLPLFAESSRWTEHLLETTIAWVQVRDEAGVQISTGTWPESDFISYRSETFFETSLENLITLIEDVAAYKEWMPDCDESTLLAKDGESVYVYYLSVKSPWPITDRDWVNRLELQREDPNGKVTVHYESYPGLPAEKRNKIRVREHFALWSLTPVGRNRVHSVWYGHSEPGGSIPPWLVRMTLDRIIMDTTRNMRNRLSPSP